ncbi:MAG: hypothetical protein JWQ57_1191 [Mucilaginibacter sp.]|nr:hypothetical protein [Mucilaginibacter sp.]
MVISLIVAYQSEPVEDSCVKACPLCFDKLSMTLILNCHAKKAIYATFIPSSPGAWICCSDNGISFLVLR